MFKGIIFDFNGTLFEDTDLQADAWDQVMQKYLGRSLGPTEFQDHFHGLANGDIVPYLNSLGPKEPLTIEVTMEKELIYRQIIRENPQRAQLLPGVRELLDRLKAESIPMAIGTASEIINVSFFIDVFHLKDWFPRERIVYDDQSFPCKPAPDIYLKAAKRLELAPADCVICEDSFNGIKAAEAAGAGRVIAVDPKLGAEELKKDPNIYAFIKDFRGFYETYFLN